MNYAVRLSLVEKRGGAVALFCSFCGWGLPEDHTEHAQKATANINNTFFVPEIFLWRLAPITLSS